MNLKLIIIVAVLGAFLNACQNKESMAEVVTPVETPSETPAETNPYTDNETKFTSVKLTQRSTFGGARSNLAGSRRYQLNLGITELSGSIEFKKLMVDSISIPFSSMIINGDKQNGFIVNEQSEYITVNAYKNLYTNDPDAPQMVEVIEYEKSGLNLKGSAVVEYHIEGKPFYLEIAEIEKLENIYAP